jgi:hypothetical protein
LSYGFKPKLVWKKKVSAPKKFMTQKKKKEKAQVKEKST